MDEVEEVVGLPVEAERVEAPQHERGVADPRVAVVPVALAARRLGQRRGGRRAHRPGRRVGQPLQRQRAALQVGPPRVVGKRAVRKPLVPVVGGAHQPLVGVLVALGPAVLAPGQRHVGEVAVVHRGARPCARALEPQPQVGRQRQLEVEVLRRGHRLVVAAVGVVPLDLPAPVVHHRHAVEVDLDLAVDAAQHPQQHVVGVVVGGRAPVRVRALVLVMPGADQQHVAHDHPAGARSPRRLQHHRAGEVAAPGGDRLVGRAEPEAARVAIEQRAEHRRAVHPRHAHPFDVAARRHQRRALGVRKECELGDRRERAAAQWDVAH